MIPYFDHVMEVFETGDQGYLRAFGRHAHWGYWPDPERFDGSLEDFERAADEFARVHFRAAGIRSGQRVLDVGCGFGGTIGLLNDSYDDMTLVGVNIDPKQIARANATIKPRTRQGNSIEFLVGDAVELDFAPDRFDAITALECIYHFSSREKFLQRAFSVLKPGGRVVISDYVPIAAAQPGFRVASRIFRKQIRETTGPMSVPPTWKQYETMASDIGFRVLPTQDITRNTVRSCDVFIDLLKDHGPFGRRLANGFVQQRRMCQWGVLRYLLLTFAKPGAEG